MLMRDKDGDFWIAREPRRLMDLAEAEISSRPRRPSRESLKALLLERSQLAWTKPNCPNEPNSGDQIHRANVNDINLVGRRRARVQFWQIDLTGITGGISMGLCGLRVAETASKTSWKGRVVSVRDVVAARRQDRTHGDAPIAPISRSRDLEKADAPMTAESKIPERS
jgi:hypothetical protein